MLHEHGFHPLPDDKSLAFSKLRPFADDNFIVAQMGRVENIVGKGENASHQLFLLFLQRFLKALSSSLYDKGLMHPCESVLST